MHGSVAFAGHSVARIFLFARTTTRATTGRPHTVGQPQGAAPYAPNANGTIPNTSTECDASPAVIVTVVGFSDAM